MQNFISIYTTFPDKKETEKIISVLLGEKLIACANIFPMESFYTWKWKVENEKEIVAFLKTKEENWEKVKEKIEQLHSYEVPCILKFQIDGNWEYKNWMLENLV